jgi:hypothetical protein
VGGIEQVVDRPCPAGGRDPHGDRSKVTNIRTRRSLERVPYPAGYGVSLIESGGEDQNTKLIVADATNQVRRADAGLGGTRKGAKQSIPASIAAPFPDGPQVEVENYQ